MPKRVDRECVEELLRRGATYEEIKSVCGVKSDATISRIKKELEERGVLGRRDTADTPPPPPSRAAEEDTRFIMSLVRQKIDPKSPIISKFVEDVSWWHHVIYGTAAVVIPTLYSMLAPSEVDLKNPEVTTKNMVAKFLALVEEKKKVAATYEAKVKELESKVSELESKISELEAEKRILEATISEYRDLVRRYREALKETINALEELKDKVSQTITFLVVYVPKGLSREEKAKYLSMVVPHLEKVWGVRVE